MRVGRGELGEQALGRRFERQIEHVAVFAEADAAAHARAETRNQIVARGRLVASGALSDILAFKAHGWELVVSHLTPAALECARKSGRVEKAVPLGEDRYALDLPLSVKPEELLGELTAAGAQLVSLAPLRETLEDFFVRQVAAARNDRGLG